MENKSIFREQSLNRLSSPEQMNDYVRVSNPGMFLILTAVVLLLVGVCVWGVFGRLETQIRVLAVHENGVNMIYASENNGSRIRPGMEVRIGEETMTVTGMSARPVPAGDVLSAYAMHLSDIPAASWVYEVSVDGAIPEGIAQAYIVESSIAPMSFVLN